MSVISLPSINHTHGEIKLPPINELALNARKLPSICPSTSPADYKLPSLTSTNSVTSSAATSPLAGSPSVLPSLSPKLDSPSPEPSTSTLPRQLPPFQHQLHPMPYYQKYFTPYYTYHPQHLPSPPNQKWMVPEIVSKTTNKCHRCGTTETPEWRRGPNGVRTLCNACGLCHAKLVKRKGAAVAAQEVLNNKVCKGKNGRRVNVKKIEKGFQREWL